MTSEDTLLKTVIIVLAILLLLPIVVMIAMMPMMGAWHWNTGWGGSGMWWMWVGVWLVLLLVVLASAYLFVRTIRTDRREGSDEALEALRIAYARGDVSDEEFEKRRKRLDDSE